MTFRGVLFRSLVPALAAAGLTAFVIGRMIASDNESVGDTLKRVAIADGIALLVAYQIAKARILSELDKPQDALRVAFDVAMEAFRESVVTDSE